MSDIRKRAEEIVGHDLNQSLHHLIGFWYAFDPSEIFDTELAIEMIEILLKEKSNPVGIEAKEITTLKEQLKKANEDREKLKECVGFYADWKTWRVDVNNKDWFQVEEIIHDRDTERHKKSGKTVRIGGKKAREVYKEVFGDE